MPSKARQKQLAKLAARRAAERRRRARNRAIAIGVVVFLIVGAGGAVAWTLLTGEPETTPTPEARDTPTPTTVACGAREPRTAGEDKQRFRKPPRLDLREGADYRATVETSCGRVQLDLFEEQAPVAVNNFVFLAEEGFYDGLTFHRLETDFVVQGGDPAGDGSGGPGYQFEDELDRDATYRPGTLAMANSGPDTNGSQFFIVIGPEGRSLPPDYTIFGEVTGGEGALDRINAVPTAPNPDGQTHHPTETIYMETVTISTT
jgi:cyclophilin family peptidyl-prolyl cis-trans isomerase